MKGESESPDYVITVNGLSKNFGHFVAVDDLSMRIESGRVHGFLGPNGSGKTTAIRMMCGLMDKTAGEVCVLGLSIPEHAEEIRDQVGYMTQRFSHYGDLTIRENLFFLAEIRGMKKIERLSRVQEVLKEFDLISFQNQLAGSLSGGQKRRLALAGAVLTKPKLLILDEPTSEVDPNTRREMWAQFFKLTESGISILVSTHLMDEAERCHHLTILNNGVKVADGKTSALKNDFPHHVVVVEGDDVTGLNDRLNAASHIISAAQSGLILRVIVDKRENNPEDYVEKLVGQTYRVTPSKASIEDVFVAATLGTVET